MAHIFSELSFKILGTSTQITVFLVQTDTVELMHFSVIQWETKVLLLY